MKDIIKNMLADSIKKTYEDDKFVELIEVQNVTAKNIKADYFTNISMKLAKELKINPIKIADQIGFPAPPLSYFTTKSVCKLCSKTSSKTN